MKARLLDGKPHPSWESCPSVKSEGKSTFKRIHSQESKFLGIREANENGSLNSNGVWVPYLNSPHFILHTKLPKKVKKWVLFSSPTKAVCGPGFKCLLQMVPHHQETWKPRHQLWHTNLTRVFIHWFLPWYKYGNNRRMVHVFTL